MINKAKQIMTTRTAKAAAFLAMTTATIAMASGIAGAVAYDPTSALTGFATTATSTAAPIVVAVAAAFIPLAIVFWAVGWALGFFGRRGRRA